jgi:hypothetical protein
MGTNIVFKMLIGLMVSSLLLMSVRADCSSPRAAHNFSIGHFSLAETSPLVTNAINLAINHVNAKGILGDDRLVLTNTIQTPCEPTGAAALAYSMIASGMIQIHSLTYFLPHYIFQCLTNITIK